MFYIGVDWANDHHDIFIVNDSGQKIESFRINHNPEGMMLLRDNIRKLNVSKEQILFAIETHKNLIVEFLLDEGYTVYSINPKSVDRYRDRYRVSGARDDYFDSMVISNIIRTDKDQFRPILPNSELARELKILTHDEQTMVRLKVKLINQIQACLKDYYPVALGLFSRIDLPVTLDFFLKFPKPDIISINKLIKFLKEHHCPSTEEKAKEIHEKLSGPKIFVEELTIRAKSKLLIVLVQHLKILTTQIEDYQKEIDSLFDQHPDSKIFSSLPGAGTKNAPRILAEIGDNRDRYSDRKNLQCDAGTAPITDKSGNMEKVYMRRACRKSFRNTMYQYAFSSLNQSTWAKKFYDIQRTKGKSHTEALRILSNKWLKIIFRMWKDNTVYDEDKYFANILRYQFSGSYVFQ